MIFCVSSLIKWSLLIIYLYEWVHLSFALNLLRVHKYTVPLSHWLLTLLDSETSNMTFNLLC